MGGRMLADRIFGAPERRDPPRRKQQPARGRKRKPAARGRARGARSGFAGGDAAAARPRGARLHRPGGLSRVRHLPRVERRHGRGRLADGALLRGGRRRDRRAGRPRARRDRPDPAALPALAEVGCGRGGGDRLRAAPGSGGTDRRARPGGRAQGPLRSRLLPASWWRPRRGPLLGHDDALPAPRRAHHRGRARRVRVAAAHGPLRLGHGPGRQRGASIAPSAARSASRPRSRRAGSTRTPT